MSIYEQTRRAYDLLNDISSGYQPSEDELNQLRSFLPPLPKQKTLEELAHDVYDVWAGTNGNDWPDDIHGELETWLDELHEQLHGLKDAPATGPALPAGMYLAKHEVYGDCVAAPNVDAEGERVIFYLDDNGTSGVDYRWVPDDLLTPIDSKPTHPEFLETEADYQNAPEGTIVAAAKASPAMKGGRWWESSPYKDRDAKTMAGESRRVLRWSWGE